MDDTIKLVITPNGGTATTKTLKLARDGETVLFKSYDTTIDDQRHDLPIFEQTDWSGGWGQGYYGDLTRFADGQNIDTYKGQFFLGPYPTPYLDHDGAIFDYPLDNFCMFGGYLYATMYAAGGDKVYKFSGTHWDNTATLAGSCSQLCEFDGYMFAAGGTAQPYQYTADGTTWTTCTLTDHHATGFIVAPSGDGTTQVLWKWLYGDTGGDNGICSNVSGINGGGEWTTKAYIGNDERINNLMLHQNKLLVAQSWGLYHYDYDGKQYSLLDRKTFHYSSTNVTAAYWTTHKGAIYFSMWNQIAEISAGNVFRFIEPMTNVEDLDTPVRNCRGIVSDGEHLYALMSRVSTDRVIYKGTEISGEDGSKWIWVPFITPKGNAQNLSCEPYGAYGPVLWYSAYDATNAGGSDYSAYMVILSENPTASTNQGTSYLFNTDDGYLETSWIDLGRRDWYKLIDSVLAECRGTLSANVTVTIWYKVDDGSWTQIDTAYTADTAGTKKYLDTAPASGKKVKFKIALATNSTTYTPIVKYFAAYGSIKPDRVRIFEFTILGEQAHGVITKTIRDFLIDGRDSRNLITLTDRFGTDHYVRIMPGYPIEEEMVNQSTKQVGVVMRVKCEKVDWS